MDDLISRQAAIMHFVKASKNYECGMFDLKEVTHELWQLPSAEPKRKNGKWIGKPIAGYCTVRCSVCKDVFRENNGRWNFCPDCGADMRGDKNEID